MSITSRDFVKNYFGIADNSIDKRVDFFIPLVENDYLFIRNKPFDVDNENNIIYPATAQETAALMIMFKLNNSDSVAVANGKVGAKQEVSSVSWGTHSESYRDSNSLNQSGKLKFGYPEDIVKRIERFIGFKAV